MFRKLWYVRVMGAAIFTEVMIRTGQESPPFLRKLMDGRDRKHNFYRSYVLHVIGNGILTEI